MAISGESWSRFQIQKRFSLGLCRGSRHPPPSLGELHTLPAELKTAPRREKLIFASLLLGFLYGRFLGCGNPFLLAGVLLAGVVSFLAFSDHVAAGADGPQPKENAARG